jgi:hypothetical protein
MKTYLQDCKTAEFIRCDSKWTLDMNEALDFLSVRRAVSFGMTELKNSFQVVQRESNDLPGALIIAISNLLRPECSQLALKVPVKNAMPKPEATRAPFPPGSNAPHRFLVVNDEDIRRFNAQTLVGSGFQVDAAENGAAAWAAPQLNRCDLFDHQPQYAQADRP